GMAGLYAMGREDTMTSRVAIALVVTIIPSILEAARTEQDARAEAQAQVVIIRSADQSCSGGIIVGDDGKFVYIATTAHGHDRSDEVNVAFLNANAANDAGGPGDALRSYIGKVLPSPRQGASDGDLAVITV